MGSRCAGRTTGVKQEAAPGQPGNRHRKHKGGTEGGGGAPGTTVNNDQTPLKLADISILSLPSSREQLTPPLASKSRCILIPVIIEKWPVH